MHTFKRTLAMLLAVMLMVGMLSAIPASADEVSFTAGMGLVASDWSSNTNFGADSAVTTTITGDGTYTMTYTGACLDLGILVVDIVGAQAALDAEGKTYKVSDVKLVIDGNEIAVDAGKIVTGDLESNGNYRIELHNMYGTTAADPALDNTTTVAESLEVTFTLATIDKPAEGGEEPVDPPVDPIPEFDPAGSYNAYLGMQTPNWSYRDEWNSANGIDSESWGDFITGGPEGTFGKVTDAVVAGNGTYTVSVTDVGTVIADDFTAAGQEYFNLLYISTNIPKTEDVTVTDVKLIIDGKTVHTYDEAYLDPDVEDYVKILIQNVWNADVAEISYYAAPSKSVEMQFTISGFSYDAEVAEEPTETDPPATNPPAAQPGDEEPNNVLPIIIGAVAVAAIAVVIVIVLKKKKA